MPVARIVTGTVINGTIMTHKKMLFLSPELPFPAHSGGKLKSLKLVEHFAKQFELTLACPLKLEDSQHLSQFRKEQQLKDMFTSPVVIERSLKNLLISHLKGIPLNVYRTESPEVKKQLKACNEEFDIIFVDHFEAAQYVPEHFQGQLVYHAHNTYHQMWLRFSEQDGFLPHRIAAGIEAQRVRRYETQLCNKVDLVFAAPNDIESLRSAGADQADFRTTYHLGDDQRLFSEDLEFSKTEESLVYVGYLGWEPNATGLVWFLSEVWPALSKARPALVLNIAGKNPDQRLQDLVSATPNVNLCGFVEDLETLFRSSRVNIAPLHFGSGMKVKVLDAMARGLPTVTAAVGAEGIAAIHGRHLAICDNAAMMCDEINQLLDNANYWQLLSDLSRQLVRDKYSWAALLEEKDAAIKQLFIPQEGSKNSLLGQSV